MAGSRPEMHGNAPQGVDSSRSGTSNVPRTRPGMAVAGIVCLSLLLFGAWFVVLFSNALTREYGVDTQGIGVDDVVVGAVFSLPGFGLALLAVWFLRRSGIGRAAGWWCLLSAVALVAINVAGMAMALAEFAESEGTGPLLASRAGTLYGILMAAYLSWAGVSLLRAEGDRVSRSGMRPSGT